MPGLRRDEYRHFDGADRSPESDLQKACLRSFLENRITLRAFARRRERPPRRLRCATKHPIDATTRRAGFVSKHHHTPAKNANGLSTRCDASPPPMPPSWITGRETTGKKMVAQAGPISKQPATQQNERRALNTRAVSEKPRRERTCLDTSKGSFTDATITRQRLPDREGASRVCQRRTLFLDKSANMPMQYPASSYCGCSKKNQKSLASAQ